MNPSINPNISYDKVFSDYLRELPSLPRVLRKKEEKQKEINNKIQELNNCQGGFVGSSAYYMKNSYLLGSVGRNIKHVNTSIDIQKALDSEIKKLKNEFDQFVTEENRLKEASLCLNNFLRTVYKNYLDDPNDESAKKVQEAITQIFKEDAKIAKNLKLQLQKISISDPNQEKLHQIMLKHIDAPRIIDLPSEILANIISNLNAEDVKNFKKAHLALEIRVDHFFRGRHPIDLLKFMETKSGKLSSADKFILLMNCKTSLTKIELEKIDPSDHQLAALVSKCPNLEQISMPGCLINKSKLEELTKLKKLQKLKMAFYQMEQLSPPLPNLKELALLEIGFMFDSTVTDKGIKQLAQFTALQDLFLSIDNISKVTLEGAKEIKKLVNLQNLTLIGSFEKILNVISELPQLKKLCLEVRWGFFSELFLPDPINLSEVAKLSNLEEISISGCRIRQNDQKIFGTLPKLKNLTLIGPTQLPKEIIDELRAKGINVNVSSNF